MYWRASWIACKVPRTRFLGAGLIVAIAFSGPALINYNILFPGFGLALLSLIVVRRSSSTRPTRVQVIALVGAIFLEVVLFAVMGVYCQRRRRRAAHHAPVIKNL